MVDLSLLIKEALDEFDRRVYLAWKRKNVSFRGIREHGQENGAGATLGRGLYTAALSNKSMSREFGEVFFVVNAVPKRPKIFDSPNQWEIWFYHELVRKFQSPEDRFPDKNNFFRHTTIEDEMRKMGFDGIIIKGREMVNFDPPPNVEYFRDEEQVRSYWRSKVKGST